jgi:hypothetical protein
LQHQSVFTAVKCLTVQPPELCVNITVGGSAYLGHKLEHFLFCNKKN